MRNWEYYKDEIKKYGVNGFAIEKDGKPTKCQYLNCEDCGFSSSCVCGYEKAIFLYQEHKESIKLTRFEFELLKYLKNKGFNFIARDQQPNLVYIYYKKPLKDYNVWCEDKGYIPLDEFNDCFQFVKWEDEEPYKIQDILDNCEVVEGD